MKNYFLKSLLFSLIIIISLTLFLSIFGIQTNKFNNLIENKSNKVSKYAKLGFDNTKIYLNILKLNLLIKLQNPKILLRDNEIALSKFNLYLPLKSFVTSDFLLKKMELGFIKNDIKDLTKITGIFLPKILNKKLNKIFNTGDLEGTFIVPFDNIGNVEKSYSFSGKISNAIINLSNDISIQNLTAEINHNQNNDNTKIVEVKFISGEIYNLQLADSLINLKYKDRKADIKSILMTKGKINLSQIQKMFNFFPYDNKALKDINGNIDLNTKVNFHINKKLRLKNLSYSTQGNISFLELEINKANESIKKYIPKYNEKIILKDTSINFVKNKSVQSLELKGAAKINSEFDSFKINETYDYRKKLLSILGSVDLTNCEVQISKLNYSKKIGEKSLASF